MSQVILTAQRDTNQSRTSASKSRVAYDQDNGSVIGECRQRHCIKVLYPGLASPLAAMSVAAQPAGFGKRVPILMLSDSEFQPVATCVIWAGAVVVCATAHMDIALNRMVVTSVTRYPSAKVECAAPTGPAGQVAVVHPGQGTS